ncbi:Protein Shroom2 [Triplophysa tibetana]|uniref:Protein Shroom2 n=1 Tax=Triplophysa tibetana TaxID=1572043 RepID=A0A5A9NG17_9TELE|nr:Protein Shroom2 [Triplophysa tibetana]
MVDVVTHTMPAESDAHVARNFLTKILRSSMRRNESSCRPHSWHSKSAENPTTDIPKSEADPGAESSCPTRYDASSASKDYTSCWGQTNLREVSCQFSSVGNMESVEPVAHAFSKESQLNKPNAGVDHSVVERGLNKPPSFLSGARDIGAPRSIATTEGMFYRGSPNELTNDCHRYLHIPMSTGERMSASIEEQAAFKIASSGRSNPGPFWHVPDKKPSIAPPPPLRSDSFTATRVHEKGLVGSFPEGFSVHPPSRTVDRHSDDIHVSERGREARYSYNPAPKNDFLHPYLSVKECNQNQVNPSKTFSRSSTDVRQAQNPFAYEIQHQRQHSDESPYSMYPSTACTPKTQSVGSYYQSLQDLPTNSETQNSARTSTSFEHNHEGQSHFRYYCITSQQLSQESSSHPQGLRGNERRIEVGTILGTIGSQKIEKTKYPQSYLTLPENGCTKQAIHSPPTEASSRQPPRVFLKSSSNERERDSHEKNKGGFHHEPNHQTEQKIPISSPWIMQEEKICPHKTPMLYSLTQESKMIADKSIVSSKETSIQEFSDSTGGKLGRRSDRYATTLRKEIQQKKAQLQKSRSAANLICSSEVEDDSVIWKSNETSTSSSDGSFTNSYKDHLKEAQAKVLKATSFMRRDLELPENETSTGQPPKTGQLSRIGGRKRFAMDKKMHSFSEPDKINEVGVVNKSVGSFVDRYQSFEGSCRPNFQKPILKQSLPVTRDKTDLTRDTEGIPRSPFRQSKSSHSNLNPQEQQRLDTFAEYEATWNMQKKTMERRNTGRFHSAENILDSSGTVCVHERSRSSPSADIHTQKISLPPNISSSEHKDKRETCVIREQNPVSIPEAITQNIHQNEDVAFPSPSNQTPRPDSTDPSPLSSHHLLVPVSDKSCPKNTGTEYQRSVWSREETPSHLETTEPGQGVSPVRKTPEPTQSFTRQCSSACHTKTLDREMCLRSEDGEGEFSLVLPVLGHISDSSQQNTGMTVTSDNRTHSPSHVFFTQTITNETHVKKTHPDIGCTFEEMSAAGQKLDIQNDSERESCGGCEESKTPQLKNSSTQQTSSEHQTNDRPESPNTSDPAQRSDEDLKREELARDIMGKDKSLVDILDQSKMKTTMDLMEGIFPQAEHIQQRRKNTNRQACVKNTQMRLEGSLTASVSLLSTSSYYSTSAPKAELLIKMKDMQEHINQHDSEEELDSVLSNKKQELMDSLSRKLQVLREARASLRDDVQDNNLLGEEVEATVRSVCRPNELEKFRVFVGDLDKVVSLLLSLSGRLARVENALNHLEEETSAEEKQTLMEKRKLLICQHEDAKELKENLDRREHLVYDILSGHLSEERLADYQHFVKIKSALIIEQRKLEDKIKLGEEQLKCLKDSLPLDQRLLY